MAQRPNRVNRIAFVTPRGQIGTAAPDGRDTRLITPLGYFFLFPTWSPDSSMLALIGSEDEQRGVFTIADAIRDSGAPNLPRALYTDNSERPFYMYWLPDGSALSFLGTHGTGLGLHLVSRDGGETRLLTTGQPCFWAWAPTSDRALIHTGATLQTARLAFATPEGLSERATPARPGLFQSPGIAPSGRLWAFGEIDAADVTRLVIAGGERAIAVPHAGVAALSWSPVEDRLAFISPLVAAHHYYGPLRLVDARTGTTRALASDTVLAFFWSPDGRFIAYLTLTSAAERARVAAGSIASTHYTNGHTNGHAPPQSQLTQEQRETIMLSLWVVEVASGQRRMLAPFQPPELFVTQFMPFFDQYALSHRLWSPDSSALVLPVVDGDTTQIVVVPRDGTPPQAIAEGLMAFWSPS